MNRTTRPRPRLSLSKQTLRPMSPLRDDQLARAAGGIVVATIFCAGTFLDCSWICGVNSLGAQCPTTQSIPLGTTCA